MSNLHDLENGKLAYSETDYLNKQRQSTDYNENNNILMKSNESNDHQVIIGENLSKQQTESNLTAISTQQIPSENLQSQAFSCNIDYTNELIGNNNNNNSTTTHANQQNSNGHAIIDVVKTTHTNVDQTKITTKPLDEQQLPSYTTQANINKSADNDYDLSVNASNIEDSNRKQQKLSNKIVVLLRRSKTIALVLINSILAVLIAISICITMGLDYTVPAIVFGLVAIVASSGLWYWFYIAAVTAPRDIRYVLCSINFIHQFNYIKIIKKKTI